MSDHDAVIPGLRHEHEPEESLGDGGVQSPPPQSTNTKNDGKRRGMYTSFGVFQKGSISRMTYSYERSKSRWDEECCVFESGTTGEEESE